MAIFMPARYWRLGALFLAADFSSATSLDGAPATDWQRTNWRGEKAWTSTSAGWTAIVSEDRARLVSITPARGGSNLLYESTQASVSWGGHRCWLGPQSKWKAAWPPPPDWEASGAAQVCATGKRLIVTHHQTDPNYPQLSRSYEWRGGVLHCGVNWQGGSHHAVQILQVPQSAIIQVRRTVRSDLPLGYALLPIQNRPVAQRTSRIAPNIGRHRGETLSLKHANEIEKIGLAPQEIIAVVDGYQLKMRAGMNAGVTTTLPDFGLLSQVYLGGQHEPFIEIEQLSPLGGDRPSSCEILVEPIRRKRDTSRLQ